MRILAATTTVRGCGRVCCAHYHRRLCNLHLRCHLLRYRLQASHHRRRHHRRHRLRRHRLWSHRRCRNRPCHRPHLRQCSSHHRHLRRLLHLHRRLYLSHHRLDPVCRSWRTCGFSHRMPTSTSLKMLMVLLRRACSLLLTSHLTCRRGFAVTIRLYGTIGLRHGPATRR